LLPRTDKGIDKDMETVQINHGEYMEKVKHMSFEALAYTIKDCQNALKCMPETPKAGYYQDEISYCAMEIQRRRTSH